ncbi:MAG: hypothetical protein DRQ51_10170 [Gammaproteobacteria bacterium]|nr:MAG: hypothetical protein DRQ51_10170 [Gammaproteobacteria bacterium]
MQTITLNIKNETLTDKVLKLLESFKKDELEIVDKQDMADLKLLLATRGDKEISFDDYLKNENQD